MLSENIKNLRKKQSISQEELAIRLNVVRQTVSKWETGASVPDAEMLIRLAEELGTSVNALLGETNKQSESIDTQDLAEKLSHLNEEIAKRNKARRKTWRYIFFAVACIAIIYIIVGMINDIYYFSVWDKIRSENSVIGGSDSPTNIYVSSIEHKIIKFVAASIIAALAFIGVYKTKQK